LTGWVLVKWKENKDVILEKRHRSGAWAEKKR